MRNILLINGNAGRIPLADKSVQCVVTSPPYWGLRDYGVSDQLGLEATPEAYVAGMVAVFREVWRVLRDDGVLWLNMGDSYAGGGRGGNKSLQSDNWKPDYPDACVPPGLKPKDLVGIPWRLAFALQADGWWLRSDCIWAKPNPMPESVTDRPTKAHEYVFLLTKASRYYYDADAVREGVTGGAHSKGDKLSPPREDVGIGHKDWCKYTPEIVNNRNLRTVWQIATAPYSGAHFATFPPALVERCIKAGSRKGDVVFDPFAGSGTTVMVANQLGRRGVGLDISLPYLAQAQERTGWADWQAWTCEQVRQGKQDGKVIDDLPLFREVL